MSAHVHEWGVESDYDFNIIAACDCGEELQEPEINRRLSTYPLLVEALAKALRQLDEWISWMPGESALGWDELPEDFKDKYREVALAKVAENE